MFSGINYTVRNKVQNIEREDSFSLQSGQQKCVRNPQSSRWQHVSIEYRDYTNTLKYNTAFHAV